MNDEILVRLGEVSQETKGCEPGILEQHNELTHSPYPIWGPC
jgi:hypothetical protein